MSVIIYSHCVSNQILKYTYCLHTHMHSPNVWNWSIIHRHNGNTQFVLFRINHIMHTVYFEWNLGFSIPGNMFGFERVAKNNTRAYNNINLGVGGYKIPKIVVCMPKSDIDNKQRHFISCRIKKLIACIIDSKS